MNKVPITLFSIGRQTLIGFFVTPYKKNFSCMTDEIHITKKSFALDIGTYNTSVHRYSGIGTYR